MLTFKYFLTFFQLIAEYQGEKKNWSLRRLGPGGIGTGSLKLKSVQKSIHNADRAISSFKHKGGSLK